MNKLTLVEVDKRVEFVAHNFAVEARYTSLPGKITVSVAVYTKEAYDKIASAPDKDAARRQEVPVLALIDKPVQLLQDLTSFLAVLNDIPSFIQADEPAVAVSARKTLPSTTPVVENTPVLDLQPATSE